MYESKKTEVDFFVNFCVTHVAKSMGKSEKVTKSIFSDYELLGYLESGYPLLHTQGKEYLVVECMTFLQHKGYDLQGRTPSSFMHGFDTMEVFEGEWTPR